MSSRCFWSQIQQLGCCFLLHCCSETSLCLKKIRGFSYDVEIKPQISSWFCDGISFLIKCPGEEAAWEECPGWTGYTTIWSKQIFKSIWIREFSNLWGDHTACVAFWCATAENLRHFSLPTCKIIVLSLLFELFESYTGNLIAHMAIWKAFSTCSSWTTAA